MWPWALIAVAAFSAGGAAAIWQARQAVHFGRGPASLDVIESIELWGQP